MEKLTIEEKKYVILSHDELVELEDALHFTNVLLNNCDEDGIDWEEHGFNKKDLKEFRRLFLKYKSIKKGSKEEDETQGKLYGLAEELYSVMGWLETK